MPAFAGTVRWAAVVAAALVLGTSRVNAADPLKIPVIISLTGVSGFLGQGHLDTLRAIETMVNKTGGIGGRMLTFDVQDDTTNAQVALQLVNRAIAAKVPVIIGPISAPACGAALPLLKDGPVVYCMSNGVHPPPGSYMFTSAMWTDAMIDVDIRYLRLRGLRRIAMITSTDATGQDAERSLDAAFKLPENKALTLVESEHFNPTDISVSAQMERIRASNPDLVILWSSGTPAGTLFRGDAEAGLSGIPTLTTAGNLTFVQMKQYADFLPHDLYFAGFAAFAIDQITDPRVRGAAQSYASTLASTGLRPDYGQVSGWDPTMLVIGALRKLGPDATAEQVRAYLAGLRGWVGADGVYDFTAYPQRGLGEESVIVLRWEPSKQTWLGVSKPGGTPL